MYAYMNDLVKEMRKVNPSWNMSELLRMIIQYFFMAHMMGEIKKPFLDVKNDFMDFLKDSETTAENVAKNDN